MMRVAIHQPHYFPWLGFFDKMAKVDKFVVLDDVQLTDRSPMVRNKFLEKPSREKYLSVSVQKKGYREKKTSEILLNEPEKTLKKHQNFILLNYSKHPYFEEIYEKLKFIFSKQYSRLLDLEMDTILIGRKLFDIHVPMVFQSELCYDRSAKNSDLMLSLCQCLDADLYLSGNGARAYMDIEEFKKRHIKVAFQEFTYPVYPQYKTESFIPNLSAMDLLFNCGIEQSREIFWNNVHSTNETDLK